MKQVNGLIGVRFVENMTKLSLEMAKGPLAKNLAAGLRLTSMVVNLHLANRRRTIRTY